MTRRALDILEQEHQLILRALRVAEAMSRIFVTEGVIKSADLNNMIEFIKFYADEFHHMKEEDVLFKWMAERGVSTNDGPVQVMLYEHDVGRNYVSAIQEAMLNTNLNVAEQIEIIVQNLKSFVSTLAAHIFKEDHCLYPMVDRLIDDDGDAELLKRYQDKISDEKSSRTNLYYCKLIEKLELSYRPVEG